MARARNIKPSFFTNEQVSDNCPLGRLLFIGLWTMADYKGDLEWKEKTLKIQILPWDDCSVKSLAITLDKSGLIRFYSDGVKIYIHIPNFEKHQNPHKNEREKGSEIPDYSDSMRQAIDLEGLTINRDLSGCEQKCSQSDRAESLLLNPESLNLNPESVSPKSQQVAPAPQAAQKGKPKSDYPDWFEDIWKIYPSRAGGNDKRKAFQAANARLKAGRTKEELRAGVERYRYYVVATGKVSTEFVKMASSFFGPNDNLDNPWTPPQPGGGGKPPAFDSLAYVNRHQRTGARTIDMTIESPLLIAGEVTHAD